MSKVFPRRVTGIALAALLAVIAGSCRTAPEEEPAVDTDALEIVLLEAPRDGASLATDEITIRIDPGRLDLSLVESFLVRVEPGRDYAVSARRHPRGLSFLLPVDRLEDGRMYRFSIVVRLTDGREGVIGAPFSITFALGLPRPVPDPIERNTLNPRPRLAWTLPDLSESVQALTSDVVIEIGERHIDTVEETETIPFAYGAVRPRENVLGRREIEQGTILPWTVRVVSPRGVLGPRSAVARLRYDPAENVPDILSARTGDLTLVARPGFSWSAVSGAEAYHLEYRLDGNSLADEQSEGAVERTLTGIRYRLSPEELETLAVEAPSADIRWRVRAENSLGVLTPWSPVQVLRHVILVSSIAPVMPPGAVVEVVDGAPAGSAGVRDNETPPVAVMLDRPYGLARNLLTVEAVAELFNQGIRRERLHLSAEAVTDRASGVRLLALNVLDFGTQIGLYLEQDEEDEPLSIGFDPQYRSHPAVGVTWYGAVWLMNRLSRLEARDPAYQWIVGERDTETVQIRMDPGADGYRLPTEAEWALAVGQRERISPSGDGDPLTVTVNRPLSSIELRGVNYLRSGDMWEDPEPPFTRAGGPTNPVGALGIATPAGIYDLAGNVWEWVWDWYHPERSRLPRSEDAEDEEDAEAAAEDADAGLPVNFTGPRHGEPDVYGRTMRVVRGGAWNTPRAEIRRTIRGAFVPDATSHSIGVRPARTLSEQSEQSD